MSGEVYSTPESYVGAVAPISVDLSGVILLAAPISRLDGVTFAQLL